MKLGIVAMLSAVLMIAYVFPVSAETVGNLQQEEKKIIITENYSQMNELIALNNKIVFKHNEILTFEKGILPCIQWNIPPDIMTLSANGKLEGNFFLGTGDIEGEFDIQSSAKSEALYKDFNPYVSGETTREILFFARKLLEENGTYSPAEQVLAIQLKELENKGINESEGMHIFYIQKLYNSIVDIRNELDVPVMSIAEKMQTERFNKSRMKYFPLFAILLVLAPFFMAALDIFEKMEQGEKQKTDTIKKRFYGVLFVAIVFTVILEMSFVVSVMILSVYSMYYVAIWVLHSTLQEGP